MLERENEYEENYRFRPLSGFTLIQFKIGKFLISGGKKFPSPFGVISISILTRQGLDKLLQKRFRPLSGLSLFQFL